jgi:hypothetical protein
MADQQLDAPDPDVSMRWQSSIIRRSQRGMLRHEQIVVASDRIQCSVGRRPEQLDIGC